MRELFDLSTKHQVPAPVIFYYGETGVGKSSVLNTGVVPRLETRHQVIYVRRKPELGCFRDVAVGPCPTGFFIAA